MNIPSEPCMCKAEMTRCSLKGLEKTFRILIGREPEAETYSDDVASAAR